MKSSIIWKLVLSGLIVAWAALNLFPINNQEFAPFAKEQVTAQPDVFEEFFAAAQKRVQEERSASLVLALQDEANERRLDLQRTFFPHIDMVVEHNLEKKNAILVNHIYKLSRGRLQKGLDLEGGASFILQLDPPANRPLSADDLKKAIEIISSRVNALGVAEPIIRPIPPNRIEVQMPGVSLQENPEAADSLIRAAKLEFRVTNRFAPPPDASVRKGTQRSLPIDPRDPSRTALYEAMESVSYNQRGQEETTRYWVKVIPEAYGNIVNNAYAFYEPNGQMSVGLTLTSSGAEGEMSGRDIFGKLTTDIYNEDRATGTKQFLAIVLDGDLESAPGINTPITEGRATISGSYTENEVRQLVSALNNPLEFDLRVEQKSEIGPSLAADARSDSINAALYGAGLVVIIMLLYYFSAGVVAMISVAFSMIIVIGVMASLGATLTLPGVAALVLTVATAVDGNILVFERMREELREGKDVSTSLKAGYEKALSTIVDANLTTLITAAVLIYFGHGPIKGFGVTLCIGIAASMLGVLVFSRAFLEILVSFKWGGRLVPQRFEKPFRIPFMRFVRPAFITSWAIVLIGMVAVVANWGNIAGVDFRGGAELTLGFKPEAREEISIAEIDRLARSQNLGEVTAVFQTTLGGAQFLKVQTDDLEDRPDQVLAVLQQAFPNAQIQELSRNVIGATVSGELVKNAIISVVIASLAIMFYVAVRFEWGFAMGALVSTIHDILVAIGIFVIFGQYLGIGSGQFTAPMVAGILMVIGYSLNDTIIVFDRIREELNFNPSLTLKELIDRSLNFTLSRTMLTSVTTFVAAIALAIYGAGIVADFALLFLIGIFMGTFSSIYIACPVFYWWHKGDRQKVTEQEAEALPVYEWEARTPRKSGAAKTAGDKPGSDKPADGQLPSA